LREHLRKPRANDAGYFAEEIVPVEVKSRKSATVFDADDHLRPETTLEGLAKLRPALLPLEMLRESLTAPRRWLYAEKNTSSAGMRNLWVESSVGLMWVLSPR